MAKFLKEEYLPNARDTDGYNALPNGKDIYAYYVKTWTTTNKTPDEIHKTGLQEVARIREEMEKVKAQVGYNGTLEELLVHVKNDPKTMPYKNFKRDFGWISGDSDEDYPEAKNNV